MEHFTKGKRITFVRDILSWSFTWSGITKTKPSHTHTPTHLYLYINKLFWYPWLCPCSCVLYKSCLNIKILIKLNVHLGHSNALWKCHYCWWYSLCKRISSCNKFSNGKHHKPQAVVSSLVTRKWKGPEVVSFIKKIRHV